MIFFNESNNYVSYSVSEIIINEYMCYKELYNNFKYMLCSFIDMNNIDIYICLCLKE